MNRGGGSSGAARPERIELRADDEPSGSYRITSGLPTIRELNGSVNTAAFHSAVARLAGKAGCPVPGARANIFQSGDRATAASRIPP
jgi:hypothetical protein